MANAYQQTRVLVTGADGFIGSHLVERLVHAGARVTALSLYNSFDSHGWLDDLDPAAIDAVEMVRGDVRDPAFVTRVTDGHEMVYHLAALIAIPHSYAAAQSYVDTNVTGTLNVLEAARLHATPRVVCTSTSEVYGSARFTPITEDHPLQGQSPYSATKIAADMLAEAYARSFDLPVVILRPFNTYGPRQSERAVISTVIRQILDPQCQSVRIGDLTPKRDFNYVADTVDAFLAVGTSAGVEYGVPYNAGSGRAVSIAELVDTLRMVTGSDKPVKSESARIRPQNSEVRVLLASSRRLQDATGWSPRVSLDEGLGRTVQWWREHLHAGRVRGTSHYMT